MFRNIKDKIDILQTNRFVNDLKNLSESDLPKDIKKFNYLIVSGKMNLKNDTILKYYITWHAHRFLEKINRCEKDIGIDYKTNKYCGRFNYSVVESLLEQGISMEQIMQNSDIERELVNSFVALKNSELRIDSFEHPMFLASKLKVINELIKIPKYQEIIQNSLDVQKYGELFLNRNFKEYNEKYFEVYKKCVAFLLELGYVPFKNKNEISFLIDDNHSMEMQKYYNRLGLIDKKITSKLYQIRFEILKNDHEIEKYFFGDKKTFPIFSELEIDKQDKMVNYWRTMSDLLNADSMVLVLVKIFQIAYSILKLKNEEYSQRIINRRAFCEKQFTNGLPNSNFFNGEVIRSFIKEFIDSRNERELDKKLFPFFLLNLEKIKGSNKGFFKVLQKLEQVHKDLKADLQETFLSFVGDVSKIDTYFDKNGVTPIFYEDIKYQYYNKLLPYIDSEWEQHYTSNDANLIKCTIKCPRLFYFNQLTDISRFFDENGFTEEFYSYGYFRLDFCTIIAKLDSNWEQHFTLPWIRCIHFLCQYPQYKDKLLCFLFDNQETSDEKVIEILNEYFQIKDQNLRNFIKEYIKENCDTISKEKIRFFSDLYYQIEYSNANEIMNFKSTINQMCLLNDNPLKVFKQIESIFLKNNLPTIGKIFSVFKLLHPNYDFNFSQFSEISPMLKYQTFDLNKTAIWGENAWRDIIIFSDLVRAAIGSNNKSLKDYIENLEMGNQLFLDIFSGTYEQLDISQKEVMVIFTNYLNTLYNNTVKGKKENNVLSGDIIKDIQHLKEIFSPNGTVFYNLPDQIVKMYFHFAGFDTLDALKTYWKEKIQKADARNRKFAEQRVTLEVGDFIKGIKGIDYLHHILQNGSLAKEFLGASADSDSTPLDTDLSRILEQQENIEQMILNTPSKDFGPIYFLLKNNERFIITRGSSGVEYIPNNYNREKIEIFRTLNDVHYGIRTGFASSEINCILMKEYDKRVGLEIALNGFYIPIADFSGKVVFTPYDYDLLRSKMAGLSYFGEKYYSISPEINCISVDSILEEQEKVKEELTFFRKRIYQSVQSVLRKYGLGLRTSISNDLRNGFVELLDTGSTSRETYVPDDIDFDFVMRLDRAILVDNSKFKNLKHDLLQIFHQKDESDVIDGQFRLKKAYVDGIESPIKIDVTFTQKTNKISYTTDLAIQDYLTTIKKQGKRIYKQVLGNIILAKQVLKQANVYKPSRKDSLQGSLGGVGIEIWILQNGGSFLSAAKSFIRVAEGKDFDEFKKEYFLWDFGSNFLAQSRGIYPHDNFIDNMNECGYQKMKATLENYLLNNSSFLNVDVTETLKR